jgi:hypothetical protein
VPHTNAGDVLFEEEGRSEVMIGLRRHGELEAIEVAVISKSGWRIKKFDWGVISIVLDANVPMTFIMSPEINK